MPIRVRVLLTFVLLLACVAIAESKKKPTMPPAVLKAHTAIVLIDPDAGIPADAPLANTTAQGDVERAITKWGRLSLAMTVGTADLIIVVRKGNGKLVQQTVGGVPTNDRPIIVQPSDTGIRVAGQQGHPPDIAQPDSGNTAAHPQMEVGPTEDTFTVFNARLENPMERAPSWRYTAKDALHSPEVPAVDVFRTAIEEAEKQLQKTTKP
ncbi:MAG TPA: hypothetical protein VJW94_18935 [Candidatus Acidoferrum sp.]|nr:hypothetical protein [Candidatus Acidoferrum sp.]